MAHDKKISDENATGFAATGTDGAPRPPSLGARLATASTSAKDAGAPLSDSSIPASRKAEIANGALPPPLPASPATGGLAPPPLPTGGPPKSADTLKISDSMKISGASPFPTPKQPQSRPATDPASESSPASEPKSPSPTLSFATTRPLAERNRTSGALPPLTTSEADDYTTAADTGIAQSDRPREDEPARPPRNSRREARRRPAGPVRERLAANDDAPSIGGLIYALQQKPSTKPYQYAAIGSVVWAVLGTAALWLVLTAEADPYAALLQKPATFLMLTAVVVPIMVIWFLALLASRSEELRLRSSTMAEVAIRLAEPDRLAEQSTASLGQAVRRQVGFMNDAVSRALGRAGELEALVHNEVSALERSYEENERKIRGLIQELSGERIALLSTSEDVHSTLKSLGSEVPALIEKLSSQQIKLAQIIEGAGENLTLLETSLSQGARQIESSLGERTEHLQSVLHNYTGAIDGTLIARTEQMQTVLENYSGAIDGTLITRTEQMQAVLENYSGAIDGTLITRTEQMQTVLENYSGAVDGALQARTEQMHTMLSDHTRTLGSTLSQTAQNLDKSLGGHGSEIRTMLEDHTGRMGKTLGDTTGQMQGMLETYTSALAEALASRTEEMQDAFEGYMLTLDTSISNRTDNLQSVFEAYALALDTTLASRAEALDTQLVARTRALDDAFNDRLRLFDETIVRTTSAIDEAVGEKTVALTSAFNDRLRLFDETIVRTTSAIDEAVGEKTVALTSAFNDRLRLFDETIVRTTSAIDEAVGEKTVALTSALDSHAKNFRDTLTRQTADIDDTLTNGISAVRRSSENVTRQSLKAIEGLANQSDLLKRVSENLLGQINSVTNRFENQGQLIMQAANALESANYKIDATLKQRHSELSGTLDRLSHKADEFSQFIEGYSNTIEDQFTVAENRAKATAEELRLGAHTHQRETLADLERFRNEAGEQSQRALADLRQRFSHVTDEVTTQFGNLSTRFDETSVEVRQRAEEAARAIEEEQDRLHEKLQNIPNASRDSAEAMRRSLQDQLNALEQLSQITSKEARNRDISEPAPRPATPTAPARITADPASLRASYDRESHQGAETDRQLSSLSSSLAREIHSRPLRASGTPANGGQPVARQPAAPPVTAAQTQSSASQRPPASNANTQQQGASRPGAAGRTQPPAGIAPVQGDGWSLGDLLKRASLDDDAGVQTAAHDTAQAPLAAPGAASGALPDVSLMVQAIDPSTASEIWERLRSGQRGIMVPSLYPPKARAAFDELSRRYHADASLRESISRFLSDFEHKVRSAEQTDKTGRQVQAHLLSDLGRAYLFLAHVSGHLDA